uniref:hypothetical protein n=3 Tax=Bacteria TaxID=2 RepID=UPI003703FD82
STRARRDVVADGMGAGDERRQQTDRASRRLIDGMGAPARVARERATVEEAHQAKRASERRPRSCDRHV